MTDLLIFLLSFVGLWIGAGLVVNSVELLSKSLKLPTFVVSFFVLGIMTSLPEIGLGLSSVMNSTPEVYVGTLIGGVIVIFLLVIPLFALLSNGVSVRKSLPKGLLGATIVVVASPSIAILDQRLTLAEGVALILLYLFLFLLTDFRQKVSAKLIYLLFHKQQVPVASLLLKIIVGIVLVLLASQFLVQSSVTMSKVLSLSPYIFSLILLALGTNLPELSLCFRALWGKKPDIALGDYLGSAATNTLLMGGFTVLHGKTVILPNHALHRFVFLFLALAMFILFSRSDNKLSRQEGFTLAVMYIGFIILELSL